MDQSYSINVTQHGKITATCFFSFTCYAALTIEQKKLQKTNLTINRSLINIKSTYIAHGKKEKSILLAKETYHFLAGRLASNQL